MVVFAGSLHPGNKVAPATTPQWTSAKSWPVQRERQSPQSPIMFYTTWKLQVIFWENLHWLRKAWQAAFECCNQQGCQRS